MALEPDDAHTTVSIDVEKLRQLAKERAEKRDEVADVSAHDVQTAEQEQAQLDSAETVTIDAAAIRAAIREREAAASKPSETEILEDVGDLPNLMLSPRSEAQQAKNAHAGHEEAARLSSGFQTNSYSPRGEFGASRALGRFSERSPRGFATYSQREPIDYLLMFIGYGLPAITTVGALLFMLLR